MKNLCVISFIISMMLVSCKKDISYSAVYPFKFTDTKLLFEIDNDTDTISIGCYIDIDEEIYKPFVEAYKVVCFYECDSSSVEVNKHFDFVNKGESDNEVVIVFSPGETRKSIELVVYPENISEELEFVIKNITQGNLNKHTTFFQLEEIPITLTPKKNE